MAYDQTTTLALVKARLNRLASDTTLDDYLTKRIEAAVKKVLAQGYRTADIYETEMRRVGTREMGDAVVAAMQ